jgi:hypothetical protein
MPVRDGVHGLAAGYHRKAAMASQGGHEAGGNQGRGEQGEQ